MVTTELWWLQTGRALGATIYLSSTQASANLCTPLRSCSLTSWRLWIFLLRDEILDTVQVCFEAFKADKCKYYSISNKKLYSIIEVAKMFKCQVRFLKPRLGERYASALTKIANNNKIIQKYGKLQLKDYISYFIKSC